MHVCMYVCMSGASSIRKPDASVVFERLGHFEALDLQLSCSTTHV